MEGREAGKAAAPGYNTTPGRFHFMLRRLHSAMGLVFGGYIAVHLLVNSTGMKPREYQMNVDKIHSLEPMLPLIELTTIFIPLLLHALYGLYIVKAGVKFNTTKYRYGGNIRYSLQRWTAVILLLFIAFHVGTLHKWGLKGIHNTIEKFHPVPDPLPHDANGVVDMSKFDMLQRFSDWADRYGGAFQPHNKAFQTTAAGIRNLVVYDDDPFGDKLRPANMAIIVFYLLGIWSATFHLANGLWTSAIAWGLTVTAASQRRWGHVCMVVWVVVTLAGTTAWYAFALSPNAQGDVSRWDDYTHTLPEEDPLHEQGSPNPDTKPPG